MPTRRRRMTSIGIIGAGAIVRAGHLPAYRAAGFEVAAIADIDSERAHTAAREFGISEAYDSPYALIASDVDVVDIAVPANEQPDIALAAISAGKAVLCQKPLALSLHEAVRVVEAAEKAHVPLAVNQQMRWSPLIKRARELLESGAIGEPERLAFDVSIHTDFSQWTFLRQAPRLEFMFHSIHYFDAVRHLLGDPERLTAWASRSMGQETLGETRTMTVLEFPSVSVSVSADHNDRATALHRAELRVVGSEGTIVGEIGLLFDYPQGRPDRVWFARSGEETAAEETLAGAWFPDAFTGPMSELLAAVAGNGNPMSTSGRDNLRTLGLVLAAYESVDRRASVVLDDWFAEQLRRAGT